MRNWPRLGDEEGTAQPGSRALMLIHPKDDPSSVEAEVEASGFVGFKVYHVYADRQDTFNAECHEFLPDWAWEIANRRSLAIMLHIVRSRALADPSNQQAIRAHCLKYPGARLILAHAARGFCAAHTVEGIASLRGIENVYFDTSAICEPPAYEAILREFGPRRLLFGTDQDVHNPAWILGQYYEAGLTPAQEEMIMYRNAKRLFGL